MSLNRVTLVGRMVRDPELRTTGTGRNVAAFQVAVPKKMKSSDGTSDADFIRVKCWSQTADFVHAYGAKGRLVSVDGRLEARRYQDKEGNTRDIVEVVAENVNLLDRKRAEEGAPNATSLPDPFADD